MIAERKRVPEATRTAAGAWKEWGPYLSERAWGTVREDYSQAGTAWEYFPHDHARSRAYRWSEDGLAGFCDIHQRLCLALALWNGRDPILKEGFGNIQKLAETPQLRGEPGRERLLLSVARPARARSIAGSLCSAAGWSTFRRGCGRRADRSGACRAPRGCAAGTGPAYAGVHEVSHPLAIGYLSGTGLLAAGLRPRRRC